MSCFYLQSKSYPLSHQKENISLAAIIQLTHFISVGKKQHSLAMFIKSNKITLYVNFNKRKREYIVISIIPIGAYFYIQNKTILFITLLAKI